MSTEVVAGPGTPAPSAECYDETGWRERKKRQTRHALHKAAVEMVAERGISQVTTEEIAEAAGVSARTFFNYFPTKESSILGMGPDEPERVAGWLRERPDEESDVEAVRGCLRQFALELAADPDLWRLRRTVVRSDPAILAAMAAVSTAVERSVASALADRMGVDIEQDLRPSLLVSVTWSAVRIGMAHSRDHHLPVEVAIDEALDLLDHGMHA